jgi:hypothetical protein
MDKCYVVWHDVTYHCHKGISTTETKLVRVFKNEVDAVKYLNVNSEYYFSEEEFNNGN